MRNLYIAVNEKTKKFYIGVTIRNPKQVFNNLLRNCYKDENYKNWTIYHPLGMVSSFKEINFYVNQRELNNGIYKKDLAKWHYYVTIDLETLFGEVFTPLSNNDEFSIYNGEAIREIADKDEVKSYIDHLYSLSEGEITSNELIGALMDYLEKKETVQ